MNLFNYSLIDLLEFSIRVNKFDVLANSTYYDAGRCANCIELAVGQDIAIRWVNANQLCANDVYIPPLTPFKFSPLYIYIIYTHTHTLHDLSCFYQ